MEVSRASIYLFRPQLDLIRLTLRSSKHQQLMVRIHGYHLLHIGKQELCLAQHADPLQLLAIKLWITPIPVVVSPRRS